MTPTPNDMPGEIITGIRHRLDQFYAEFDDPILDMRDLFKEMKTYTPSDMAAAVMAAAIFLGTEEEAL